MNEAPVGNLGSLAQAARSKQLKTARALLYFIGIITLIANGVVAYFAESIVDGQLENEIAAVHAQGMEVDQAALEELRARAVRSVQVGSGLFAAMGVVFVVFGALVYRAPVPITIASLVLYLGSTAVFAYLDPSTMAKGVIIKILIVVGLFKAVQSALASEKEKSERAALDPLPAGA